MPRISEFFGLVVYMYWFDFQKHKTPHIHVRHRGVEATFDLSGNVLDGNLGPRVNRLIEEWCEVRQIELRRAWKAAIEGKEIPWVSPLQ
jgi:hypothetical protein